MASVSASHVILFIAAISLSALVAGTTTNTAGDIARAIDGMGNGLTSEINRDLTVISDPGSPVYNNSTNTLNLLVKNTGSERLPTRTGVITVLVDGVPATNVTVTVVGEHTDWRPGDVAHIQAEVDISDGPHRVIVSVEENEDLFTFPYDGQTNDSMTVFVGSLNSIATNGGQVTTYLSSSPSVVGPATADFDGDGSTDIPYIHNDALKLVDSDASVRSLNGDPIKSGTRIAVGSWNDSNTSVFFVNSTNNYIYRTEPGAGSVRVATVSAASVVGIADFDGDGAAELVYLNGSNTITYLNPDGTVVTTGVAPANAKAVGAPADFDGDGTPRVPYVSAGNDVVLVDSAGSTTNLFTDGSAVKTGLASTDIDGDETIEVVYLDTTQNALYYTELDGTQRAILDDAGSKLIGNSTAGAA